MLYSIIIQNVTCSEHKDLVYSCVWIECDLHSSVGSRTCLDFVDALN